MRTFSKVVLKGLVVAVPVGATLYIVWWLADMAESILAPPLRWMLPAEGPLHYRPGMGVLLGLALVFVLGLLTYSFLFRTLIDWIDRVMSRLPVVKSLYGGIRDVMDLMSKTTSPADAANQVVAVEMAEGVRLLGFVTQSDASSVPEPLRAGADSVVVYLPMSYQLGGYAVVVPRDRVHPMDMSVEQGMRYALTAGMGAKGHTDDPGDA